MTETLKRVSRKKHICKRCDKEFFDSHNRVYCSKACMTEAYKERLIGENNPHFTGALIKKNCLECGKEYFVTKAREGGSKYCSIRCCAIARTTNHERYSNHSSKSKSSYKCLKCGKEYTNKKMFKKCCPPNVKIIKRCSVCFTEYKTYKARPNKYCSRHCYAKTISLSQIGDKSHFWKGGAVVGNMKIRTHKLYKEWRNKVFERDNYTCQSCLASSAELTRGKLTAHHIIPFSENPKFRLKVSNGITLCWQCHRDFHVSVRSGFLEKSERLLTEKVREYIKTDPSICLFKIHGHEMQAGGIPDYMGVVAGRATGIELKVYPNFLSQLQLHTMRRMKEAGAAVFVCRSIDEVKRAIHVIKNSSWTDAVSDNELREDVGKLFQIERG